MSTTTSPPLARRVSALLERRVGRRTLLSRAAMAGAALSTAPAAYVLRPGSAYAAICGCNGSSCQCGSKCCDGNTEFCCTLTGANMCPPGTLAGGWWKVSGSEFCGGPRYYMDCHVKCGGSYACRCANGSCNNRKTDCSFFRYGQCNTSAACVGPIRCRVVTCVSPWEFEPTCTTVSRTEEHTRYHDAPCLHSVFARIDIAENKGNSVHLGGYVFREDISGAIQIQVDVDGAPAGWTWANLPRPDLSTNRPAGRNHGFDLTVPAHAGNRLIRTWALGTGPGGSNTILDERWITVTDPHSPVGALSGVSRSAAGKARVTGWTLDLDRTSPIKVRFWANEAWVGSTTANLYNPIPATYFPRYGGNHGFDATLNLGAGDWLICAWAINEGPGSNLFLGVARVRL